MWGSVTQGDPSDLLTTPISCSCRTMNCRARHFREEATQCYPPIHLYLLPKRLLKATFFCKSHPKFKNTYICGVFIWFRANHCISGCFFTNEPFLFIFWGVFAKHSFCGKNVGFIEKTTLKSHLVRPNDFEKPPRKPQRLWKATS